MPIEIYLTPEGQQQEVLAGVLPPRFGVSMVNFAEGRREIIAIRCLRDDSAGEVYTWPSDEEIKGDIPQDQIPLDAQKSTVTENSPYETSYVSKSGLKTTLSVRYLGNMVLYPIVVSPN